MTQTLNKILYVEDDDDIRTIAQLALETVGGFVLKSCAGGAQALREGPDFAPDLILLDVRCRAWTAMRPCARFAR